MRFLLAIAGLATLVVLAILVERAFPTQAEAAAGALDRAIEAVEGEDAAAFSETLADGFTFDGAHARVVKGDAPGAIARLEEFFREADRIRIQREEQSVEIEDDRATVSSQGRVLFRPAQAGGFAAYTFRAEFELVKDDADGWRLSRASLLELEAGWRMRPRDREGR